MSWQPEEVITNRNENLTDLLQDEKNAALWDLALWGHPAWMDSEYNTFSTTAVTQLVMYHRMKIAPHRLTVAQIIGGVRGVIPDSKLAKYGDYRYDTDFEDLYRSTDDIDEGLLLMKEKGMIEVGQQSLCVSNSLDSKINQDFSLTCHDEKATELKGKKPLIRWLNKIKNVLEDARRIASDVQPLDSWTEELIKVCLRFIHVARMNDSLLKIMDSEIAFITDYEQLQKEPISELELLSLPQPEFDGDSILELKALDTLWLKLASPQARRLWSNQDTTLPLSVEKSLDMMQSSLIKVNFLRRCRHRENLECPTERIDVPKDVEAELLGSLLQDIDETSQVSSTISRVEIEHKGYFPQAHGDWTKKLFPRRMNLNTPPQRDATIAAKTATVQNSTAKIPALHLPPKVDPVVPPEGMIMPFHFYMCVPPPPLTSSMRIQAIARKEQYVQRHPRHTVVKIPTDHPMPQQVQGKVLSAPVVRFSSPGYVQTPSLLNSWDYKYPQRVNVQSQLTAQYPRFSTGIIYTPFDSKDVAYTTKHQPKKERVDFRLNNIMSRRNENFKYTKSEKCIYENGGIRSPNDTAWMANKRISQTNCETAVPFRVLQNMTRNCNIIQSTLYEKCEKQATSNNYHMKPKSQLQMREQGMTMKVNNNGLKFSKLPPLGIQHTISPTNPATVHLADKPRFMGGITLNDFKLRQEKMLYQKYKYSDVEENVKNISVDNFPSNRKENSVTCEEKVEEWLETVNHYMKWSSCMSLEEFSGSTQLEISIENDKLSGSFGVHIDSESVTEHNTEYISVKMPAKISSNHKTIITGNICDNTKVPAKPGKNTRKLRLKYLHLFESSLKLKKGSDLEGKVKLLQRYFAEMNLNRIKYRLKHNIKNIKFEKPFPQNKWVDISNKRAKSAHKDKCLFVLGVKRDGQPLSSENYFENIQNFSTNNINEFKILSRESNEFNAFPSKRMKMCSSMSLFLEKELWTYNELKGKISSINSFNTLTDDLFFSERNLNEELPKNHSVNAGMINGWMHFKIIIKTILQNILATFDNRNTKGRYQLKDDMNLVK